MKLLKSSYVNEKKVTKLLIYNQCNYFTYQGTVNSKKARMTAASWKLLAVQGCHTIHLYEVWVPVLEGGGTITCLQGILIKECFLGKKGILTVQESCTFKPDS